ncbi:MAG: polysaccharide deacetylase family protein [Oscillospiraceae bacterium]|nr:polysaccharide deacetylase family protein [Oscillospiraceae bacterium]
MIRKFVQLIGILLLGLILFVSNTVTFPHAMQVPEPTNEEPDITPEPIVLLDEPNHAIIEYGRPEIIKNNEGPLYTYIRFPQGGHITDTVIFEWAHSMYSQISLEFQQLHDADPTTSPDEEIGEINIQFDTFLVDNRYVGVFQSGEYSHYLAMPPEEIIETFNIDLESRTFLSASDILDFSQSEAILELFYDRILVEHPDTEYNLAFIDDSWLSFVVIAQYGIVVILEQGEFLPDTFPTLTVTLPYEELGSALLIRTQPPLDTPPAPDFAVSSAIDDPPFDYNDYNDYNHYTDMGDTDDYPDEYNDDVTPSVIPQFGDIDPSLPMIAITFDDGPGVYTEELLDLFELYGIRVTFFTVGNLINANSDTIVRASNLGHEIAGKSWDHRNMAKLSAENVAEQILDTSSTIEAIIGTSVPFFRPPYAAVSPTMRDVAAELGYSIVTWTIDSRDWYTKDANEIHRAVLEPIVSGAIVLNHEIHISTLEAYRRLIPELLELGFQFVTVSELFYHTDTVLQPGEVYYGR